MSNVVSVLFFATLKEAAGGSRIKLEIPQGANVAELKNCLSKQIPSLEAALPNAVISVNQEYAEDEVVIPVGAEIAIFPPVSGGVANSDHCLLTDETIDLNIVLTPLITPRTGAVCFFVGIVRAETQPSDKKGEIIETSYLEYEAYRPMAELKMVQICQEIHDLWKEIDQVAILQRIGTLQPGSIAAVVAISGSHRNSGVFEAARYGIERLKQIVPVWKKEVSSNGYYWVEGEGNIPDAKE